MQKAFKVKTSEKYQIFYIIATTHHTVLWWVAALIDTLHITQSGVALLDTKEFHEIQIVNQYDSYSNVLVYIDVLAKEFAFYNFKFQLSTLGKSYNKKCLKTK